MQADSNISNKQGTLSSTISTRERILSSLTPTSPTGITGNKRFQQYRITYNDDIECMEVTSKGCEEASISIFNQRGFEIASDTFRGGFSISLGSLRYSGIMYVVIINRKSVCTKKIEIHPSNPNGRCAGITTWIRKLV